MSQREARERHQQDPRLGFLVTWEVNMYMTVFHLILNRSVAPVQVIDDVAALAAVSAAPGGEGAAGTVGGGL